MRASRATQRGLYPNFVSLPGDLRGTLPSILGTVRRNIAFDLCWHELLPAKGAPLYRPSNRNFQQIDFVLERLPSEERLQGLNDVERDYLSYTVYGLKQMLASKAINANDAWDLFYSEWDKLDQGKITEESFDNVRESFLQDVFVREIKSTNAFLYRLFIDLSCSQTFTPELGELRDCLETALSGASLREVSIPSGKSLLLFELCLRAGVKVGLSQYEEYAEWSNSLEFQGERCSDMNEARRDERRKALWIEMRLIEERTGLSNFNSDVKFFVDSKKGQFVGGTDFFALNHPNKVVATVNLFEWEGPIDAILRAEIGHWLFAAFRLSSGPVPASEAADRFNIVFSPRVEEAFRIEDERFRSPEGNVIRTGGYFMSSGGARFPSFPAEFPTVDKNPKDMNHIGAERMVDLALTKLRDEDLLGRGFYSTFRRVGDYVSILGLDHHYHTAIDERLLELDLEIVDAYYESCRERVVGALFKKAFLSGWETTGDKFYKGLHFSRWHAIWSLGQIRDSLPEELLLEYIKDPDYRTRGIAADILINSRRIPEDSDRFAVLDSYRKVWMYRAGEKASFPKGEIAEPALRAALSDQDSKVRANAARRLQEALVLEEGTKEFEKLRAFDLAQKKKEDILSLGELAVPALVAALNDGVKSMRKWAIGCLEKIGGEVAILGLREALQREPYSELRAMIARTILGLEETEDLVVASHLSIAEMINRLGGHIFFPDKILEENRLALETVALFEKDFSCRSAAFDALKRLKDRRSLPVFERIVKSAFWPPTREAAIDLLAEFASPQSVSVLREVASGDKNDLIRQRARTVLVETFKES